MVEKQKRLRAPGGGRKRLTERNGHLLADLKRLVGLSDSSPEPKFCWTSQSTAQLTEALQRLGHNVSQRTIHGLLSGMEFELRSAGRVPGGSDEREAQFFFISRLVDAYRSAGSAIISIRFRRGERKGQQEAGTGAQIYEIQKGSPASHAGEISLAAELISAWWHASGCLWNCSSTELLLVLDAREGMGKRSGMWRCGLQQFVNNSGVAITIGNLPPGTFRWREKELAASAHLHNGMAGEFLCIELHCLASQQAALAREKSVVGLPKNALPFWNYKIAPLRS